MKTLIVSSVLILSLAYTTAPAQQSIAGYWAGSISIQGQELLIKLDFKPSGDSIVATIDIPQQNARGLALKNVRYLPPKVHFELPAGPGLAVFDGQRNDGLIAGKFTQAGMEGTFAVRQGSVDQTETSEDVPEKYKPIVGTWDGAIDIMGQSLGITVSFSMKGGALKAAIDIPQQGAKGIGLDNVSFDSSRVHLELPAGSGLAVFDGTLTANSINGAFTQAGMSGSFHLSRGLEKKTVEAEEIVPYKKEEVVFFNDSIRFAGTLTLPPTKGPFPAVVMITGSGPQNRDEELFGFKPFKVIADHFTRKGIAVLRYDDRGVGGSTGNTMQSTTADFAKDALAAIRFLQSRKDINPKQVGLCGHSEGGIVGPLAASQSRDVAFVICIAGTGYDGRKIILSQEEAIMKADSASPEKIKRALDLSRLSFDLVLSGADSADIRKQIRASVEDDLNSMPEDQRKAISNKEAYINANVEGQLRAFGSPWFKFFLTYDPLPALEKVKCPVLALFGGRDLQVLADLNKTSMESALKKGGNKDYTFKVFPEANHLFLKATTGSPKEYGTLKKEFLPGFLDTMSDWILKHTTVPD